MTADQDRAILRCRELADEARATIRSLDEVYRATGSRTLADKMLRAQMEGRAAAFDAAADIIAGVVV